MALDPKKHAVKVVLMPLKRFRKAGTTALTCSVGAE